ncbi:MAG: transposase [Planctomycetia bacterium]|nr:transposase [Planctomycetia bacterium]
MPRTARASQGGLCYHVINRGNARQTVFRKKADYQAFLELLAQAQKRLPLRILAFCLMPNHFHLALWPLADGDLSRFMQWLSTAHVRRYHRHYQSSGHVWQGRFKAFPIQQDDHLLAVLRYIERNPVRAALVRRAEDWPWSSAAAWQPGAADELRKLLHPGPVPRGRGWLKHVNRPLTQAELKPLRECVNRGRPFGSRVWTTRIARTLGLESSLRPRGRPKKGGH